MKAAKTDFCVYRYGARGDRSMVASFANTSYTFTALSFTVPNESFSSLPHKTLEMVRHFMHSRSCRALLKIDDDADVCMNHFNLSNHSLERVYGGVWTRRPSFNYRHRDKYWTPFLNNRRAARSAFSVGYMQGSAYILGEEVVRHMFTKHNASLNSGWEDVNVGLMTRDMPNRVLYKLKQRRMSSCMEPLAVYHRCETHPACAV
jgi:hypothetical protein